MTGPKEWGAKKVTICFIIFLFGEKSEILLSPSLFWPLKTIKIHSTYFNHQIRTKSSLDINMGLIEKFGRNNHTNNSAWT